MLKRGFQFAPGYRLQEFLGRGQFGQVWRANAPGGAAAAVKFIDLSDGQGQKEYDGIKRVKQIRHANLMPITAIWLLDAQGQVIEEAPDEAMETIDVSAAERTVTGTSPPLPDIEASWLAVAMLLGGKSLQQRLRECTEEGLPGIPPKELISYMDESAKGLDFLNAKQHDLGEGPIAIQHSDVKPANIVLIGSSAVVCDFGLARILSRNQVTATSAAGTPAYMAPEAIAGKPARSSDQYSLAVTYYHLRTGMLPVSDGSLWEVLDAHRLGKLKLGLVPETEQEVLRKATNLNWEERFDTNVDMVDALREALRVEGHTKAGFVPSAPRPDSPSVGAAAETAGDPTATLEIPSAAPSPSISTAETASLPNVDTHPEGFVNKTLPELDESPPAGAVAGADATSGSTFDAVKRNPKLIAAGAVGLVCVLALVAFAMRPADPDPTPAPPPVQNGGDTIAERGNTETDAPSTEAAEPAELVQAAIAMFNDDEDAAVDKFKQALDLDLGLSPQTLEMPGHRGPILKMLATPDGSRLVTIADDNEPFCWQLNGTVEKPLPLPLNDDLILDISIASDGDHLLAAGFGTSAGVWNLQAGDIKATALQLTGHEGDIEAVAWHPIEPIAITTSKDLHLGVWNLGGSDHPGTSDTIASQRRILIGETLTSLASSPDGVWLSAITIGGDLSGPKTDVLVYRWDELLQVDGSPPPVRLNEPLAKVIACIESAGQPLVIVGDDNGTLSVYENKDGEPKLKLRETKAHTAHVEAIRIAALGDRNVVVTGSSDGTVRWWNYESQQSQIRRFGTGSIGCVDVSADGRWVAAGGNDGSAWLWDTTASDPQRGVLQLVSGAASVDSILIDPQSKWLIAGCSDGAVRVWDLTLAKLLMLAQPKLDEEADQQLKPINTNKSISLRSSPLAPQS